jgi:flagellar basal-body rod modification protein FlgD
MSTGLSNNASVRNVAASLTQTATQTQGEKDRKTIAENFDAFLSLLTTQLKNQSPLDPLDANQFTQQLVQFSSVEQQLKTNDYLAAMSKNFTSTGAGAAGGKLNAASAASLIGVEVSADAGTQRLTQRNDQFGNRLEEYEARYPVKLQSNYGDYKVTIADEDNNVVFTGSWNPSGAGDQSYVWDGRRTDGTQVDRNKSYNIQVSGLLNGTKDTRSLMSTDRTGTVSAVDLSGSEEMVTFGDFSVPVSKIKRVARPTA